MKKLLTTMFILLVSMCVSSTALAQNPAPTTSPQPMAAKFNPEQVKQIQSVIHDYLLQNPELMVQVFRKLQDQQRQAMQKRALDVISKNATNIFNNPDSPVAGNKEGSVTLVEFFDYQCPHCKAMAKVVEDMMQSDKNLRVVFKEFPIFPGSMYAAQAALAAKKQGKYFEFHNALMADKNPLSKQDVINTAKKVGLNVAELEKEMKSDWIKKQLQSNLKLAQDLGLPGTPAFIIQNSELLKSTGLKSDADLKKTFFVPGQVSGDILQELIKKAS